MIEDDLLDPDIFVEELATNLSHQMSATNPLLTSVRGWASRSHLSLRSSLVGAFDQKTAELIRGPLDRGV